MLDELKKFSLSKNFFELVVKPIYNSVHFDERSGNTLKKMLKDDIHKAFWRPEGPARYDSALGGKFQEILDVYKHAVIKDHHAQLGSIAGTGGDTVITKLDADGLEYTKTIQFKTVDSGDLRGVHENIQKAAWQLCGHGGEKPIDGSVCTIEVVLLNTVAFDAYDENAWKHEIKEALDEGYRQNNIGASAESLYKTVDEVKITTLSHRFKFKVNLNGTIEFISKKDTNTKHGYVFHEKNFATHWNWLKDNWWPDKIGGRDDKTTLVPKTRDKGIGGQGAWQTLPVWPG